MRIHKGRHTVRDGELLPIRCLFCFLAPSCAPAGSGYAVAREERGSVLAGSAAGAAGLLETSAPGVYVAGDVRSGSIKRCATAVGEGAMVIRFVHEQLSGVLA